MLNHDEIARRAFDRYERRGRADGDDQGDWYAAEQELRESVRAREATFASESESSLTGETGSLSNASLVLEDGRTRVKGTRQPSTPGNTVKTGRGRPTAEPQ